MYNQQDLIICITGEEGERGLNNSQVSDLSGRENRSAIYEVETQG